MCATCRCYGNCLIYDFCMCATCWMLTVINSYYKPSIKHEKGYKCNHHHRIGTQLIKFHEFWWIIIFQGLNRKNKNSREELGPRNQIKSRQTDRTLTLEDSRRHQRTLERSRGLEDNMWSRPAPHAGRPVSSRGLCSSPSRNVLQHISTSHLDHRFKSVW
jgi:hypothetical protein